MQALCIQIMITVISKHLTLFNERWPISDEDYLGAIHYVEQMRYRSNQFRKLCSKNMEAPVDFSPGIDVKGDELNHLYSSMVIWFELESFVKAGKSFLDHLWRLVAQSHADVIAEKNIRNQKYILKAFNEIKSKENVFKSSESYEAIENSLDKWGRYLVGFRNYIEYTEPLGGMLTSAAGRIDIKMENSISTLNVCLPDNFPNYEENKESFQFVFNKKLMANELVISIVEDIDSIFPVVIREIHNKALNSDAAKNAAPVS